MGPESCRIGCIKFCEGCTKGSKVRSKVGIGPKSLSYGFQNEIMNHPCSDGVPEALRLDAPNLIKDVPNFVKDVPNVRKCIPWWGSIPTLECTLELLVHRSQILVHPS